MDVRQTILGYTLLEMMVSVLLLSLIMSFAVPAFSGIVNQARLKSGVDALVNGLQFTRIEAIRRNGRVVLCKSPSGQACAHSKGWEQGWIIFHDVNGNSEIDPGEQVLRREAPLPQNLRVTGNLPVSRYIAYTGFGRTALSSGAFQAGTITVCQLADKPGDAYQIVINSAGRARVARAFGELCA